MAEAFNYVIAPVGPLLTPKLGNHGNFLMGSYFFLLGVFCPERYRHKVQIVNDTMT